MAIGPTGNQVEHCPQQLADLSADPSTKQEDGQQRLERGVGIGVVDALVVRQIGVGMGGQGDEGLQVVADDFGGHVLGHGLLGQSGDVLQIEPVLESLERLLDAPALVVKLGEAVGREELLVEQVGHQNTLLAAGRDIANQAHALRFARAFIVMSVALVRRGQHDHPLKRARAHERAHAGEAAGIVDAHAELDGAVVEHGDQPAAGVAAVEQQQVVRRQPVQVFKQELAFATFVDVVQGGREHQVRPRQEQAEQDLIGQRGALNMAGPQTETHRRRVGGDQAQSAPARHKPVRFGARDEPVVETGNGARGQLGARLGERLLRHFAGQLGLLAKVREEGVQFGLDAHPHARQHDGDQRRQGQLAAARKRRRMVRVARTVEKFG